MARLDRRIAAYVALFRTLVAALFLTLAAAAPAAADSIAYIDKGDVWLASPDGSRKVQVTKTGGYFNVSQADDGTMITLVAGEKLRRLGRDGQVLGEFLTPISDGAPLSGPDQQVPRAVQPADLAGRDEGRLRVLQRHLRHRPGLQRHDGPAVLCLQAVAGDADQRHHRLHGLREVRPADRLDLPELAEQLHARALRTRAPSTTTRSSRRSAAPRPTAGSTTATSASASSASTSPRI